MTNSPHHHKEPEEEVCMKCYRPLEKTDKWEGEIPHVFPTGFMRTSDEGRLKDFIRKVEKQAYEDGRETGYKNARYEIKAKMGKLVTRMEKHFCSRTQCEY